MEGEREERRRKGTPLVMLSMCRHQRLCEEHVPVCSMQSAVGVWVIICEKWITLRLECSARLIAGALNALTHTLCLQWHNLWINLSRQRSVMRDRENQTNSASSFAFHYSKRAQEIHLRDASTASTRVSGQHTLSSIHTPGHEDTSIPKIPAEVSNKVKEWSALLFFK